MCTRRYPFAIIFCGLILVAGSARAQSQAQPDESPWSFEFAIGLDNSINGNVNSGAIGVLNGQTTAWLPNSYGDVYGTGLQFRFGGGYALNSLSELRGVFTFQSADANLVRLGDIGASSLYAQYSDYKTFGLDLGYRRYFPIESRVVRVFAEATAGLAFLDSINAELAAPQSGLVLTSTDFYDNAAAFTWSVAGGVVMRVADSVDVTAQIGLRGVSGLPEVDQFSGTGLDDINNDSGRLTLPIIVGVRLRFP